MQEFKVDENTTIVAEFEKTQSGFRHVAILMKDGREVDRTKVTYQNRTWESYEFETVIHRLLEKHPEIPAEKRKSFDERARRGEEAKVESQFQTTAAVASMGNVIGKTEEERVKWKEKMIKAGVPELQLPDDWGKLSNKDKEARLDKIIAFMSHKNEKKRLKDVS